MGASTPYIVFTGSAEVLGGLLLFFRRTTTLGAMVCFVVLSNIVALNYCYDVPVKLYSTNLLLMAVFLMAPDLFRLCRFFLWNQAAEPADLSAPSFQNRKLRIAAMVFQILFVGYVLFEHIHGGWQGYQLSRVHPKRPPLYGVYEVEAPASDQARWKKVAIDFPTAITVRMTDDSVKNFADQIRRSQEHPHADRGKDAPFTLAYARPDPDHVQLTGPLTLRLRKLDPAKFLLLNRGFHWINERAFNR